MGKWIGLLRSLFVYWRPGRQRGLRKLYRPWVGPDDLVFDVGAHLGDRAVAFASLGARVIALEPQPHVVRWLRWITRGHDGITVLSDAVGQASGTARLAISDRNPTVSTLSEDWRTALPDANPGFRRVRWEGSVDVPVVTLDDLIGQFGQPRFCKIDVEGFEAEVLAGLHTPLSGVSFEFVAGGLEVAAACVRRLEELGRYEYDVVLGERRTTDIGPVDADTVLDWLSNGAGGASSGDVYARLSSGGGGRAITRPEPTAEDLGREGESDLSTDGPT